MMLRLPRPIDRTGFRTTIGFLCLVVLLIVFLPQHPTRARDRQEHPAFTGSLPPRDQGTWVHPHPLPLPGLRGVNSPVRAVSWFLISRRETPPTGFASMVMKRDEISPFLEMLTGTPWRLSARHEYMVRAGSSWWSLHLRGHGEAGLLEDTLRRMVSRTRLQLPASTNRSTQRKHVWDPLISSLPLGTYRSGPYLHFHRPFTDLTRDSSAHSVSGGGAAHHLVFQRIGNQAIVLGDVLVPGESFATAVGSLYDHGMIMTSIAFDNEHPRRRRFFLHFAGKGDTPDLGRRIREFLERINP